MGHPVDLFDSTPVKLRVYFIVTSLRFFLFLSSPWIIPKREASGRGVEEEWKKFGLRLQSTTFFRKLFEGFHYTTPRSEEKSVPARMKVHEESFHEFSRVRHSRRWFALKLNEESISRARLPRLSRTMVHRQLEQRFDN